MRTSPEVTKALGVLADAGVMLMTPTAPRAFSVETVAALLEVSPDWVREHRDVFAGWYRLPGGGKNGGALRFPAGSVEQFQRDRQAASGQAVAALVMPRAG